MPFRELYGVSKEEVSSFVAENEAVRDWLGKFSGRSVHENAHKLCRFFKWLKVTRGMDLSPKELLNEQIRLRASKNIEDRKKHLRLVLEHTRDNPDFRRYSDSRKYAILLAIKNFYDYHEVPLTTAARVFGKRDKRKNNRKQITVAQARKIMSSMNQREKTILLIILQSGMEIGAVLGKMNFMWDEIISQIEAGKSRVKVEFNNRKGNAFPYFTYFSRDAVQELKKWLVVREGIVAETGEPEGHPIFITRRGTPYRLNNYYQYVDYYRKTHDLPAFVTHQLRKLFKTEASIPERGIDRNVVEFWMGHVSGIAPMGGIYDKTPEIHEEVIEREYEKLEPYINIYSGVRPESPLELSENLANKEVEIRSLKESMEKMRPLLDFVESFDPEELKEIASVLRRNYMITSLADRKKVFVNVEVPNMSEEAKKIGAEKGLAEDEIEKLKRKLTREYMEKELGVIITPKSKKLRKRWGLP